MNWEPQRGLSHKMAVALTLLATNLPLKEAARQAGVSLRHLERVRASKAGAQLLREQRGKYLDEIRRARVLAQHQRDMAALMRR